MALCQYDRTIDTDRRRWVFRRIFCTGILLRLADRVIRTDGKRSGFRQNILGNRELRLADRTTPPTAMTITPPRVPRRPRDRCGSPPVFLAASSHVTARARATCSVASDHPLSPFASRRIFLSIAAFRFNMFFRGATVDDEASAHCLSLPRKGFWSPACSRGARDHSPAADFKIAHAAQTEASQRGEILTRSVSEEIGRGPRLLFGSVRTDCGEHNGAHRYMRPKWTEWSPGGLDGVS